ncbi:MAG: PAS domain S-box protein, partial [Anaerolineales bacterium]
MATPLRVLILEDRASDADLMLHELRRAGFQPEWERVEAKGEFLLHLNSGLDVILADFRMPQFDAPSALRLIQERGLDIPFIVVSGTIGEDVAVSMMREGATDYLLKDRLARLGQAVTRALEQKQLQQEKRQAEEAMRESEKLYRTLVETAPDAVTMTDLEGRITFASQKTLDLHGFDRLDEVLGRNAFDLIAPEDHEKAMLNLEKTLQEGVVANCEYIFLRKDGTRFQGGLNASMIRNGSGEPNGFIATTADISERKGVQRRDRLLQAASQMLTASAEAGEASRGLLRAICENLDWDRGELWGVDRQAGVLRCVGSWHNSSLDLAQFEAITEETAFAPGVGLPGRVWVTGEPAWISDACLDSNSVQAEAAARMGLHAAFAFPIRFGSELLGVMAVFNHEIQEPETDLMEMLEDLGTQIGLFMKRKRMEEEVRHQATLLRNIQDAVISTDMDFMIESWNEAAEEMYGWKAEEALGRPLGELFHGEYPIEPPEYAPNGFLENGHFEGEVIHCRKDGSPLNVLTSVSLLRDDEGEPVGAVAVNRDITELKRVEEKLRKALGDAKRSNEELEQFAYIA